ncbi:gag-pol polyprotein precursor, partial [Lasius niger]
RSVLFLTAKLFDPLGWLAPNIISAKIAIQSTWLQGLDWDTPLDDAFARQWQAFQKELSLLKEIRVPRWIGLTISTAVVEVHGFADAFERA